jgi:hypothetical protein
VHMDHTTHSLVSQTLNLLIHKVSSIIVCRALGWAVFARVRTAPNLPYLRGNIKEGAQ